MEIFSKFYRDHQNKLFYYLIRLAGDYDLAKDLMQESFTRYLEHYKGKPNSISLLFTIARNAFLDYQRKQGRQKSYSEEEKENSTNDQEQQILVRDEYRRVLEAMNNLGKAERDTLALVITGDLSYKEIASITGMSLSNVKVTVHRARLKLRKILYDGGM
jgi:RNA polymerase sigma-70 factor (ECF subfamily)